MKNEEAKVIGFCLGGVAIIVIVVASIAYFKEQQKQQKAQEHRELIERSEALVQDMEERREKVSKSWDAFQQQLKREREMRKAGFSEREIREWANQEEEKRWREKVLTELEAANAKER